MPGHVPGDYLVCVIECELSYGISLYMVKGWGSEWFLRY